MKIVFLSWPCMQDEMKQFAYGIYEMNYFCPINKYCTLESKPVPKYAEIYIL